MANSKTAKYDAAYLRMAAEWSKLSYCQRRQVGALIVKGRSIISDGYNGTPSGFENFCEDEDGYTETAGDCDDTDAAIHPNAEETAGDGVDSNCDGADDT